MFSTRVIRRSFPLAKPPRVKLCNGQYYTGVQLASDVCCTAKHARAGRGAVFGVAMGRLKSTVVMEPVADQMPGKEHLPLTGQLVLSDPAASAADGDASAKPTAAAVFPWKEPQARPTDRARASKAAGGASFRSYTTASAFVPVMRCFASDSKASDDGDDTEGSTGNAGAGKTAPTRRKTPAKKVPKARKEAFQLARKAGAIERLIKGGGMPRDSSTSGSSGSREDLTPSWDEKDYQVGGAVAGSPAVGEALTSKEFLADGAEAEGKGEGGVDGEGEGQGEEEEEGEEKEEGEEDDIGKWESNSAHVTGDEAGQSEHPVLGRLIASLGYKKVFLTSIAAVVQAPVWEKRKLLRPVHVMEIAEAKLLKKNVLEGIPGVITLYKRPLLPLTKENQKYTLGIVDGQHRLGALLLMAEHGRWDREEKNVVIEVFETRDEEEIGHLFAEINRAEPMVIIDDPREGLHDITDCVDRVVLHLFKNYREMFGGKRCRPPTLNNIVFKKDLMESGLIERHELYTPQLLLDYLLRVNSVLAHRDANQWAAMVGTEEGQYGSKKSLTAALKRSKRYKFWLGMDTSWMLA